MSSSRGAFWFDRGDLESRLPRKLPEPADVLLADQRGEGLQHHFVLWTLPDRKGVWHPGDIWWWVLGILIKRIFPVFTTTNCSPHLETVCASQGPTFTARAWHHSAATSRPRSIWPPRATSCCCGGHLTTAPTAEASTSDTWVSIKVCIQFIIIFSFYWCIYTAKISKNHGSYRFAVFIFVLMPKEEWIFTQHSQEHLEHLMCDPMIFIIRCFWGAGGFGFGLVIMLTAGYVFHWQNEEARHAVLHSLI